MPRSFVMKSDVQNSWENILKPEVLRMHLLIASVYIAGFESLKSAIIGRPRDFFVNGFRKGEMIVDPKYAAAVVARHRSLTYASLDWLKEMGAIDSMDIAIFNELKNCRNKLAHELLSVASNGIPEGVP